MKNHTKNFINLFVLSLIIIVIGNIVIIAQTAKNYEFTNGNWFDGKRFEKKTFYSVNGVFSSKKPKQIDETIDLKNAYVVPPFGDTHNHSVEFGYNLQSFSNAMFEQGIFYLKNPNSVPQFTKTIADKINKPNTIDVVFAGGGLTGTDGHPGKLYDVGLANGPYKFTKITSYNGLAYHVIDNESDLESKWEKILADKPDFIKTYLLVSEEYEKRRDDKKYYGYKGLNPEILHLIVEKAHKSGLRVSTHVNTAFDFGVAVNAGVDEINHLPGHNPYKELNLDQYLISEKDAKLAGEKGIYVAPTYSLFSDEKDETYSAKVKDVQRKNLKLLNKYGVRITFGPDSYNVTSQKEAFYIKDLGVFSNLELLKMWSEYTPQTIFPKRKIARLKDKFEASFITMPENPLKDFDAVKNINYRFKQGFPIIIEKEKSLEQN